MRPAESFPGTREEWVWRRNQWGLTIATFMWFCGFAFVSPFLPFYIQSLGVERFEEVALWSGLIYSISPLVSGLTAPLWGVLGDRFGRKMLIQRSLLLNTVVIVLMGLVVSPGQLLLLRVFMGLSGGFATLAMAMVSASAPSRRMGQSIGMIQTGRITGFALGPIVGGFAAELLGLRSAFFLAAALGGATFVLSSVVLVEDRAARGGSAKPQVSWPVLLTAPGFRPALGLSFLLRFIERSFDPAVPLLVARLMAGSTGVASMAGIIVGLGTLATAMSAVGAGRLSARWSPSQIVAVAATVGAALCAPLVFVGTLWQLLVLRVAVGLMTGGGTVLALTLGGAAVPEERRSTAFGVLGSATAFANASGSLGGGAIMAISLPLVFGVDAGLYLACGLLGWWIHRQATRRQLGPAG